VPQSTYFAWRGLRAHGWTTVATSNVVWLLTHGRAGAQPIIPEPPRERPVFCQGWYGETTAGRYMSETHAPFWIYGGGQLQLHFFPSPLARTFTVDGRPQSGTNLRLGKPGWHVVTVQVPHLIRAQGKKVGLDLLALSTSP
jgi:hypothetical protein